MFRQVRRIHAASRLFKAQLLDMPAMSPTMTEGGIVSWSVQPGESFSAGDVLLEIETDKAQIAVEAQDDGILAKILKENGAKEIAVGAPIAVLCDPEDDIGRIDLDALMAGSNKKASKSGSSAADADAESGGDAATSQNVTGASGSTPLKITLDAIWLPSVGRLAQTLGIDPKSVKGTGPHGRVLKGDVLAAAGKIAADAPKKLATEIEGRQHLDLSYKPVAKKEAAPKQEKPKPVRVEADIGLEHLRQAGVSVEQAIAKAGRLAVRDSILAAKPKSSVLRSPTLDLLCEPKNKVPYSHEIQVLKSRGQPLLIHISAEYFASPTADVKASKFVERARFYLTEGVGHL